MVGCRERDRQHTVHGNGKLRQAVANHLRQLLCCSKVTQATLQGAHFGARHTGAACVLRWTQLETRLSELQLRT